MTDTPRALVVDWGGVLTTDLITVTTAWAEQENFPPTVFYDVMRDWFGPEAQINPVLALEMGQMQVPHFETHLAEAISARIGQPVNATGLLDRMFLHFTHAPDMTGLVRRAKDRGVKTALLSNSWGNTYPDHIFDGMFDAVVISGEVGMRKPDPEIYWYTCRQLTLPPHTCVFVDDLEHNVEAAVRMGFIGVHHRSYQRTADELSAVFDMDLTGEED